MQTASWFETRGECRAPHHEGFRLQHGVSKFVLKDLILRSPAAGRLEGWSHRI